MLSKEPTPIVVETEDKKKKTLSKEEVIEFMKSDKEAVEGYVNTPIQIEEISPEEVESEEKPKEEEKTDVQEKAETKEALPIDDIFTKLERELSKPDGQEDLKEFTDREKAYFHQMRRDRRNRQKAEEERDAALFREISLKKEKETVKEPEPDILDNLSKKDPTDFLTVAEVIDVVKKITSKSTQPKVEVKEPPRQDIPPDRMKYLQLCELEAKQGRDDYEAVMELLPEIISPNEQYKLAIAEAAAKGENPAVKTYELIKNDSEFSKLYPVAQTKVQARRPVVVAPPKTPEEIKKEADAKKAEEAFERNQAKPKTTGHVGTSDDKAADELSLDDIARMSSREFARLPKRVREKYLKSYG